MHQNLAPIKRSELVEQRSKRRSILDHAAPYLYYIKSIDLRFI